MTKEQKPRKKVKRFEEPVSRRAMRNLVRWRNLRTSGTFKGDPTVPVPDRREDLDAEG